MTAPALSDFESLVQRTMAAAQCSREKAEAAVRRNFPALAIAIDREERVAVDVREKEEQAYIAKLFRGFGCKVYNLSQARATKQTPGLADLWVVHRAAKLAFWFEVKRADGGRLSDEQREFMHECDLAGVRHAFGDRRVAAKLLLAFNLARAGDGPCGIVPFHDAR